MYNVVLQTPSDALLLGEFFGPREALELAANVALNRPADSTVLYVDVMLVSDESAYKTIPLARFTIASKSMVESFLKQSSLDAVLA